MRTFNFYLPKELFVTLRNLARKRKTSCGPCSVGPVVLLERSGIRHSFFLRRDRLNQIGEFERTVISYMCYRHRGIFGNQKMSNGSYRRRQGFFRHHRLRYISDLIISAISTRLIPQLLYRYILPGQTG